MMTLIRMFGNTNIREIETAMPGTIGLATPSISRETLTLTVCYVSWTEREEYPLYVLLYVLSHSLYRQVMNYMEEKLTGHDKSGKVETITTTQGGTTKQRI